ncbi:uncharacterized protein B0H18DRAFT_958652 [Fomitopsis serialis]|uniref:uncharacterized protein n=1 Tax=Fomitopsis serialis TaxID=139415 RepID=UPI002007D698|nr:uncharacterized protein B0H18DRAFT_958652 [Neoantrodia serialis]KAH9916839.1 hypothetical protein B0H18DRAFT_958652 [Neoantrodia serialis]
MSRFGKVNPCVDYTFALQDYVLGGKKFDALPSEMKTIVSRFTTMDPKLTNDPERVVTQRVALKRGLLRDLLTLDDRIRTRRDAVRIQPYEAGRISFLRWWQGTLRQETINQIMQNDLRRRNKLVTAFVMHIDALVWVETFDRSGSPKRNPVEIREYRDELLTPVAEVVNHSLMFLGEYMLSPSEDTALDGDSTLCEGLD